MPLARENFSGARKNNSGAPPNSCPRTLCILWSPFGGDYGVPVLSCILLRIVSERITRLPRPEFCPHFARRRIHLHCWERRFLPILGVCAEGLNVIILTHKSLPWIRFFRGRVKKSKPFQDLQMARKWITFLRSSFVLFFRKSTKRWLERDFSSVKNAWKSDRNYWVRILTCCEDDYS